MQGTPMPTIRQGLATQAEREEKAAERIFGLLPDDQRDELRGLFEEFEANEHQRQDLRM